MRRRAHEASYRGRCPLALHHRIGAEKISDPQRTEIMSATAENKEVGELFVHVATMLLMDIIDLILK